MLKNATGSSELRVSIRALEARPAARPHGVELDASELRPGVQDERKKRRNDAASVVEATPTTADGYGKPQPAEEIERAAGEVLAFSLLSNNMLVLLLQPADH